MYKSGIMQLINFFKKINFRSLFRRKKGQSVLEKPWLEHYDENVPSKIYIPDITLNDVLNQSIQVHSVLPIFYFFGKKFTYQEFERLVAGTAAGLLQMGIKKGDRIALLLPNMPQFMVSYWAILRVGGIVVPINPLLASPEIKTLLNISRPQMLFVLDRFFKGNKRGNIFPGLACKGNRPDRKLSHICGIPLRLWKHSRSFRRICSRLNTGKSIPV